MKKIKFKAYLPGRKKPTLPQTEHSLLLQELFQIKTLEPKKMGSIKYRLAKLWPDYPGHEELLDIIDYMRQHDIEDNANLTVNGPVVGFTSTFGLGMLFLEPVGASLFLLVNSLAVYFVGKTGLRYRRMHQAAKKHHLDEARIFVDTILIDTITSKDKKIVRDYIDTYGIETMLAVMQDEDGYYQEPWPHMENIVLPAEDPTLSDAEPEATSEQSPGNTGDTTENADDKDKSHPRPYLPLAYLIVAEYLFEKHIAELQQMDPDHQILPPEAMQKVQPRKKKRKPDSLDI